MKNNILCKFINNDPDFLDLCVKNLQDDSVIILTYGKICGMWNGFREDDSRISEYETYWMLEYPEVQHILGIINFYNLDF
jgi:hypothetical protein